MILYYYAITIEMEGGNLRQVLYCSWRVCRNLTQYNCFEEVQQQQITLHYCILFGNRAVEISNDVQNYEIIINNNRCTIIRGYFYDCCSKFIIIIL